MAKILVAEDDLKLCEMTSDWLKAEDHIVESAVDGADASERLKISTYDLLILDWDMPFITGVELCKSFRQSGGTTPILILTGKDAVDNKIEGLDSGADDYLTKPFNLRELSARVKALLRRPVVMQNQVLKCRNLELDTSARQVRKDGHVIELFPRELALLEFLIKHSNQVFSLEALQERIWPSDSETSPETLRVHIARLRTKIETEGQAPILKTVHRQGYMLDLGQ